MWVGPGQTHHHGNPGGGGGFQGPLAWLCRWGAMEECRGLDPSQKATDGSQPKMSFPHPAQPRISNSQDRLVTMPTQWPALYPRGQDGHLPRSNSLQPGQSGAAWSV